MPQSELRRNLITQRWVVIAADRGKRPQKDEECPFCPGNEAKTPPTILSYAKDDGSGWKLRVVPNSFRAFSIEGVLDRKKDGVFRSMNARGANEVLIVTPDHKPLYELSDDEMNDALWACRERMLDLRKAVEEDTQEKKIHYIIIFGNQGDSAGASKAHAHLQLIGLPIVPKDLWEEFLNCKQYWDNENECLSCKLTAQENNERTRIVSENDNFLSICDYAGGFPFETWILPKNHFPLFEDGTPKNVRALAEITMDAIRRIGKAKDFPSFNIYLRNAPVHDRTHDRYYHFTIKILPRLTQPAGFEFGTGFFINPAVPEDAAQILREVKL